MPGDRYGAAASPIADYSSPDRDPRLTYSRLSPNWAHTGGIAMMSIRLSLLCAALVLCAACASDGSFRNPFASEGATESVAPAPTYYFSEFPDVPIPIEMEESKNDTFITFAASGVKCGVQRFTGRVDVVSLMNTMRRNLSSNGWTLRSLLRAKESVLVFDKPDRVVAFHISDGVLSTQMWVFMTSRLEGDAVSFEANP
jgi:hypothetical protein